MKPRFISVADDLNDFLQSTLTYTSNHLAYSLPIFAPTEIENFVTRKYENAIFQGFLDPKKLKTGLGALFFDTGEAYFGEFKNDRFHVYLKNF